MPRHPNTARSPKLLPTLFCLLLSVMLLPSGASAGLINLAYIGNGAVPTANNSAGLGSLNGAIDGGLNQAYNGGQNTYWANRVGAWYEVALPANSVGSELQYIRVIERDGANSVAPMSVTVYDASNTALATYTQATAFQTATGVTFNVTPGITTATKVRLEHTGFATGDMFLTELELVAFDPIVRVGGTGTLGTYALAPTSITGGSAGTVDNVRSIRLVANGTSSLQIAELQAFDGLGINQALDSNGGYEFLRYRGFGLPSESQVGTFGANRMTDGDPTTFEDSGAPSGGAFVGVTLAASMNLADLKIITRSGIGLANQDLRLELYSDAARTMLVFSQNIGNYGTSGATYTLPLVVGGLATASLDPNETYQMELNYTTGQSDLITVNPLQAGTTQLTLAGDLVITSLAGTPTGPQTFHLFDADTLLGSFDSITLPTLTGFFQWDTSSLYTTGDLILAIPEPTSLALLGLAGLLALRRQR